MSGEARQTLNALVFSLITGISVGAVVFHQSMAELISRTLQVSPSMMWSLSVCTQMGYVLGLVFILPLADKIGLFKLIPIVLVSLGTALVVMSFLDNIWPVYIDLFVIGFSSISGQLLIIYASKLTSINEKKYILAWLFSSLFTGLVLARILSGIIATYFKWQLVYLIFGIAILILSVIVRKMISQTNTINYKYIDVLKEQINLLIHEKKLIFYAVLSAIFFAASNGIWANISNYCYRELNMTSSAVGILATASLTTILSPKIVNILLKKIDTKAVIKYNILLLLTVSLVIMLFNISIINVGIFLIFSEYSVRSVQYASQTEVLSIDPNKSGRLNGVFMSIFFIGAPIGSYFGGIVVENFRSIGLFLFSIICMLICALWYVFMAKRIQ